MKLNTVIAAFIQRIAGPQGEGPKLKLTQIKPDEFALDGTTEVRFKFIRSENRRGQFGTGFDAERRMGNFGAKINKSREEEKRERFLD